MSLKSESTGLTSESAGLKSECAGLKLGLRGALALALCCVLVEQPVLAEGGAGGTSAKKTTSGRGQAGQEIQGEQRTLHALNRLTFGPRLGEVAAVDRLGLDRWFEQQLNPSGIDDSGLEARLGSFPAMRMSQTELMARYPSPQVIRQMIAKNEPLPSNPVERAIYADQIAFYKMQKAKQEATQAAQGGADGTMAAAKDAAGKEGMAADDGMEMKGKAALPGDGVDPGTPAMSAHVEQLYSGLEAVKIINLPPEERMQRILAMPPAELIKFRRSLSQRELAEVGEGLSPMDKETLASLQGSPRMIGGELLQARLVRDIYSDRQLEAVMTDFWLNHFNVYVKKNQNEPFLLPAYEREVIRPHALGKFEDLLVATAKSPAMLMYLDNWQSIGPDSQAARNGGRFAAFAKNPQVKQALKDRGLNENYARELMELHTLGVQCEVSADRPVSDLPAACGAGYTQKDVTEVAKVLTGWTIERPAMGAEYQFEERRHEPGAKQVLGKTIHEDGEKEGRQVLHMLATSPATAEFISNKLAVRFVSDTPPEALVERMAKSFLASDGDIKTVLRTMVHSPEFWSPEVYRAKVKTPLEFVVSAVRASGAEVTNAQPLVGALDRLGMPLYGMQTPNGYSWMSEPWVSTGALVSRMNFALVLAGDRIPGTRTDWTGLLGEGVGTAGMYHPASLAPGAGDEAKVKREAATKERRLETMLMRSPVSERTRSTVLQQFEDTSTQREAEKSFPIRADDPELLAGAMPGGQMATQGMTPQMGGPPRDQEAAVMAGLLLGSPEFQRR